MNTSNDPIPKDTMALAYVVLALGAVTSPCLTILAVDQLWPQLAIPLNFGSWLAMAWLHVLVFMGHKTRT